MRGDDREAGSEVHYNKSELVKLNPDLKALTPKFLEGISPTTLPRIQHMIKKCSVQRSYKYLDMYQIATQNSKLVLKADL